MDFFGDHNPLLESYRSLQEKLVGVRVEGRKAAKGPLISGKARVLKEASYAEMVHKLPNHARNLVWVELRVNEVHRIWKSWNVVLWVHGAVSKIHH